MVDLTFFALSPSVYMIIPQLTEQYGQVLRVSVVRASLKLRVSANAAVGENPIATRLDPTSPAPLTRKNCLRFMSIVSNLLWATRPLAIQPGVRQRAMALNPMRVPGLLHSYPYENACTRWPGGGEWLQVSPGAGTQARTRQSRHGRKERSSPASGSI